MTRLLEIIFALVEANLQADATIMKLLYDITRRDQQIARLEERNTEILRGFYKPADVSPDEKRIHLN